MRIGIDARIASYNNSGISRYFWGLVSGLAEIGDDFRYTVYFSRRRRPATRLDPRFSVRYLLTPPHNFAERYSLPFELRRSGCSLFHAMDFFMPGCRRLPQILSVYDLYFLRDPASLSPASFRHYGRVTDYIRSAAHVICSSEATRADVLSFAGAAPERVSVVYPGLPREYGASGGARVAEMPERYMLFVGTVEPRKNLVRLFEAYKIARETRKDLPVLILAGRIGHGGGKILARAKALGIEKHIRHLGEIDDERLRTLYRGAEFVVYPSVYEGFGFPLIEAMASGVPVLSSNVSSIPEVAGGAAYLVDPEDTESIAGGIARLAAEPELRQELIAKGAERAKFFSWRRAAEETAAVYRKAGGSQ